MYLLDTNVVSELRTGKPQASPAVRAWAAAHSRGGFYICAITVWEHELGVLRLERRTPPQGAVLRAWWNATRKAFAGAGKILPFDERAGQLCAQLHVPDPMSLRDSMIAATALAHGLAVVTRNVRDFGHVAALQVVNPWEHQNS